MDLRMSLQGVVEEGAQVDLDPENDNGHEHNA